MVKASVVGVSFPGAIDTFNSDWLARETGQDIAAGGRWPPHAHVGRVGPAGIIAWSIRSWQWSSDIYARSADSGCRE